LTLGDAWRHANDERFDAQLAEASLSFYEPDAIPKPNPSLPREVTEVRFRADLSGIPAAVVSIYRAEGGLFKAALGGKQ
jgi:hypothetical protein